MSDPEGTRVTRCGKRHSAHTAQVQPALQRSSSVPEGLRPELIIAPDPAAKAVGRIAPRSARRDPLLEPEMVAARVRTETLKELGNRLGPFIDGMETHLASALEQVSLLSGCPARERAALLERLAQALGGLEGSCRGLFYHTAKAAVGMAETQLPALIRDAVKRAFPGTVGVGFRLPGLREKISVAAHPQHLLEALTLAVGMVLARISFQGELLVCLPRGDFFQEIVVAGVPAGGAGLGELPRPEDAARLRHLIASVHQGTVRSSLGENGEVRLVLALPLRRMEAEARP